MPIISKQELSKRAGAAPGLATWVLVGKDHGSQSLHIEEVTVAPDARIPRCVNPHTEVAVIVQEGLLDAILGRERMTIGPGHRCCSGRDGAWLSQSLSGTGTRAVRVPDSPDGTRAGQRAGSDIGFPLREGVERLRVARGSTAWRGTLSAPTLRSFVASDKAARDVVLSPASPKCFAEAERPASWAPTSIRLSTGRCLKRLDRPPDPTAAPRQRHHCFSSIAG